MESLEQSMIFVLWPILEKNLGPQESIKRIFCEKNFTKFLRNVLWDKV
jgi:hypothetical protein